MIQFEMVWKENHRHDLGRLGDMIRHTDPALTREVVDVLVADIVYLAYTDSGEIAGITTASKNKIVLLNNNCLYQFHCFIAESFRQLSLEAELSRITFEWLEENSTFDEGSPIGIFSILKSDKSLKKGVWLDPDMYLIGFTGNGFPIRVHYFKNARI